MVRITLLSLALVALTPALPGSCFPAPPDDEVGERRVIVTQATAPPSAEVGETVALFASAVADLDAGPISYSWLQSSGFGVSIISPNQAGASFVAPSLPTTQQLGFTVTTTNPRGDVGRADVSVAVLADPDYGQTPEGTKKVVARAGPDREAMADTTVTLDGSSSRGEQLTYEWTQLRGSDVDINNSDTERASFTAPDFAAGGDNELEFQLVVRNSRGRSDTDTIIITVTENPDAADPTPRVRIETSMGDILLELDREKAPVTVRNFLEYVDDEFYDGTIFHRVIADFVIQGGGFEPGLVEKETNDPIENEADNGLTNDRGTIAMARTSDPNSATSQFFINVVDNDSLNPGGVDPTGYTVFGKVLEGLDVVDAIAEVETHSTQGFSDVPVVDVVIERLVRVADDSGQE